jgi:chorismate mutase/prephenate dehydratase
MRDLGSIRPQIDEVDSQLVELFQRRMALCEEVAGYKVATGKEVLDKKREEGKLKALRAMADTEFNGHCIVEVFSQIMSMSRKMQYRILSENGIPMQTLFGSVEGLTTEGCKVVYQGVEGAYSQQAMLQFFGEQVDNFHVPSWRDAMECIQDGRADYGILAIENSSAGIVNDTYDLLNEYDNCIVAETYVKIEHALLGLPGAELDDIKTVYSHPQGLMQCSRFLESHAAWQQISYPNTAASAKKVLEDGDKGQAAIASELAGRYYGLQTLQAKINHNQNNTTRFVIISRNKIYCRNAKKVSICFEIPHASGTLYNILSHIIFNNLSMTKIESRPIEGQNWEYRFFVDLEGNLGDFSVMNALRGIQEEAIGFKILGNY